jgi:hypothetical protein
MPKPGRRRTLDRNKKTLLCDAVSRGATLAHAAASLGVSIRTVQREARRDADFDQKLRQAHHDTPEPLAIMQSAARTHWRAAAWLLERTNSEEYGRRPAASCSPFQFERALMAFIELTLKHTPAESRSDIYASLHALYEEVFDAVFPNHGPRSRRLARLLSHTPLTDAERCKALGDVNSPYRIPDYADASPQMPQSTSEHPAIAERLSDLPNPALTPTLTPTSVPVTQSRSPRSTDFGEPASSELTIEVVELAASQSPAPAPRLPWRYLLRAARTNPVPPTVPITASHSKHPVLSLLSPKTRSATECDTVTKAPPPPPHSAPTPNPVE